VGNGGKRAVAEEATNRVTNSRAARSSPWTLPNDVRLGLVESLGIMDAWPRFLRDSAVEHPETLETLTAARAFPAIEEAVALSREVYVPLRPAALRDRLGAGASSITGVMGLLSSHELMIPLHDAARQAGSDRLPVDARELKQKLERLLAATRKLHGKAKAETSRKRTPDLGRRGLIWMLAMIFEQFSQIQGRKRRTKGRERFIKLVLQAAGLPCPRDLPRWLPPRPYLHFVAQNAAHKMQPKPLT